MITPVDGGASGSESLTADRLSPPMRRLAPREQQNIDLISRGQTDKAIAAELSLSVRTVRTHLERLYRKQDLHSRAEAVAFSTAPSRSLVAVGDFNGDGKPDLALVNANSSEISIMLGNGDGTFHAAASYGTGNPPVAIAVGDFNGDGRPDLAVVNANSSGISVMLGNGDGTFQAAAKYEKGNSGVAIAVGDFNGDGKADLAVVDGFSNEVSILLGNSDGTFQAAVSCDVQCARGG